MTEKALPEIGEIKELLGPPVSADRPQPLTGAAGHNHAIAVVSVHISIIAFDKPHGRAGP